MDIKITLLNVKDGDAILIELFKPDRSLVLVIDGGEPQFYKTRLKPCLLKILESHQKKAPDIVVCTHYDSDHIGGLIPLLEDYIHDIREVWVHKTPQLLTTFLDQANRLLMKTGGKNIESRYFHPRLKSEIRTQLEANAEIICRSLPQLRRLVDLIPTPKLREVFHYQRPLNDWPEISILGPTQTYYNSLFPPKSTFKSFIREEALSLLQPTRTSFTSGIVKSLRPCELLKKEKETKLTATNKASILVAIDEENRRFLFTGDAGIESFKAIPSWNQELKNLYFLKVPHHASENNISAELIRLMQPVYAYSSGDRYQDDAVLQCLATKKRNKLTCTTKDGKDLIFDSRIG